MNTAHVRLSAGLAVSFVLLVLLAATGCSRSTPEDGASQSPAAASPSDGLRTIEIRGGDDMKFDVGLITAAPGEELRVVLINVGRQPKAAMGHNWVLLGKGVDAQAFVNAAIHARETDYLPTAHRADILAHTGLIGPNERSTVTFTAPAETGDYVYLCSFPAHFQLGMKGVLQVRQR